jgi:acetyl-CoA carboxylase carboxyltransferase component
VTRPVLALRRAAAEGTSFDVRTLDSGRTVVWVEIGGERASGFRGVPLSAATSEMVVAGAEAARRDGLPLVVVMASTGADIVEGVAALEGWGRMARSLVDCSGIVPTAVVVDGPAVSGPALLLGVADLVVMTESSYAFVNGPVMVEEFTGVAISVDELGGSASLARNTGVPTLVVADRAAAVDAIDQLLGYLPDSADSEPPRTDSDDPVDRACPEAGQLVPATSTGSYDVRHVAAAIVDADSFFEVRERWATNVVTAFATVDGRPIGIVANQPMSRAGTLDIPASQKAARFVALCDAFNLGVLTLVDTPGFYPGKDLEWRGMIRHGAQLVFAYARATVPRVCVILRKSYGGAYIVMDSKEMGNDACFAWPWAELAVMGAGQAAAILRRRATAEERAAFETDYSERLLNPYVAAERGYVDAVIDPADTRREVAAAFEALADKREVLRPRKHGNEPL